MNPDDLVQPIAVLKNSGYHEHIVRQVAVASISAYLANPKDPIWEEWLSGRFTKTVRRGTKAQLDRLFGDSASSVDSDEVSVLGFRPMRYKDFPEDLAKMRVADFERPRCGTWAFDNNVNGPTVVINKDLGMSTGKTAAQVAHALFAAVLKRDNDTNKWWNTEQFNCVTIMEYNTKAFEAQLAKKPEVVITDAGFTEINPNTATVLVQ